MLSMIIVFFVFYLYIYNVLIYKLKLCNLPSLDNRVNGCNISTNVKLFFWQISSANGLHTAPISGENTFCTNSFGDKFCDVK